eukprot:TRINITY_DN9560_c0_g1_i1.p1 TRINITY_DN9560_c0_g1~~TRINITY_DN9560_c0_g1_i1.p1  ORF type:complete len:360 (+),score=45.42 TRINITY_DN9560_c0_g1_i1:89-1168(+)
MPDRGREISESSYESDETAEEAPLVKPLSVSGKERERVREIFGTAEWKLERRRGLVRPMLKLPSGRSCVVAPLGECGDRKCGNYRLGPKTSMVRPDFLHFCVDQIKSAFSPEILKAGIVYCSLGSGQLLFDWELLEQLTRKEGVRLRAVHLIDKDYGGPKRRDSAIQAQRMFAGWFEEAAWEEDGIGPCPFRSFLSALDFQRWVARTGQEAHVLLDCDAVGARKRIDVASFRKTALRPDGICLILSNPAKRTALAKRCQPNGSTSLEQLTLEVYRRGDWRHRSSVSHSRTLSRRRSRKRKRRSASKDNARREECKCHRSRQHKNEKRGRSRSASRAQSRSRSRRKVRRGGQSDSDVSIP